MEKMLLEQRYCAHNYNPLPVVLTKGKGVWVWDHEGRKYLDMISAYSALSFGHCHPKILKALYAQAKHLAVTSRAVYTDNLGPVLKKLCDLAGLDAALPMNTGAEAVETAIKAARLWGYQIKGIEPNSAEIIVAQNNFHGRTTTIVGFSSEEKYRKNFGPFTPGFKTIPFGSTEALISAITPQTCAFLVEPIQGEAGILIPPDGWLKSVAQICKKNGILLLLDEIQSGLGRTGKLFAFEHEELQPDGIMVGKALGGGFLPISAFVGKKEIIDLFTPGSHGSTFGGNPLAAAVAYAALNILKEENLVENSFLLGNYFLGELKQIQSPYITAIRGKGLWIGMDLHPNHLTGREAAEALLEKGILCKETHQSTIRFAPPLTITKKEIDWALKQLRSFFEKKF